MITGLFVAVVAVTLLYASARDDRRNRQTASQNKEQQK